MKKTIRIIVKGRVQGVFYRQSTHEKAREFGITGTVQNNPDDSVEIIATGEEEQLGKMKEWCKLGPPRAKVNSIKSGEIPLKEFEEFTIVRR
jgi:acylphosphatase